MNCWENVAEERLCAFGMDFHPVGRAAFCGKISEVNFWEVSMTGMQSNMDCPYHSAFSLGQRKTTENVGGSHRPQVLSDGHRLVQRAVHERYQAVALLTRTCRFVLL